MFFLNPQWQWKNWQNAMALVTGLCAVPLGVLTFTSPSSSLTLIALVVAVLGLIAAIYCLAKGQDINNDIEQKLLNDPLLMYSYNGDLEGIKKLNRSASDLGLPFPKQIDPVALASLAGHSKVVEYLLNLGASAKVPLKGEALPAILAARMGHLETFKVLQKHSPLTQEELEKSGVTQFMIDCFLGDEEKVLSQKKEFLGNQKDDKNLNAFCYAVLGSGNDKIIKHLLDLNSDINIEGSQYGKLSFEQKEMSLKIFSPLHLAIEKYPEDLILTILKKERTYRNDHNGVTVLMKAVKFEKIEVIRYLAEILDVTQKDKKGLDAIDYARAQNNVEIEKYLKAIRDFVKKMKQEQDTKQRSKDIANGIVQPSPNETVSMSFEDVQLVLQLVTKGLVGVDQFVSNFSHELKTFMDQKGGSRGIVLWGGASVGKTELGRRMCGLKENFQKLNLPGLKFKYIACCDEAVDVKQIIESTENKTVIFLDEIDKYLSPSAGLVSESQAKGLRTSIVTNFERKEIFWVFSGTFADIRGNTKLTRASLEKTLGAELASRLDFSDWMLNDWTIESLLKAAQNTLSRDQHIDYEDKALENLVKHILQHNAGVRGLEKAHESIKRAHRSKITADSTFIITEGHVSEYIAKES